MIDKTKVENNENRKKQLVSEIRVHWAIQSCGGAIKLLELFEDENYVYLILEYQKQGTLLQQIIEKQKIPEKDVKVIMEQLLLTIDFMHQKHVIHRDLKLDNVLIGEIAELSGEFSVKIADFGLACIVSPNPREKLFEKCGTPCYAAPEILRGQGYSLKADMFSLGSLFFNLITGRYLFPGTNKVQVMKKNKECDLAWIHDYIKDITKNCRSLLLSLVEVDPSKRPTAREALLHPWFQQDEEAILQLLHQNDEQCRPTLQALIAEGPLQLS